MLFLAKLECVLLVTNLCSDQLARVKHHEGRWSPFGESYDENGHIRTKARGENAFGLLAWLPRLVGERDINSLNKRTQALTDTCSDSLSVASFAVDITLRYLHPLFSLHLGV